VFKKYNINNMIIQKETPSTVVRRLELIAIREETKADKFLATALKTANEEGRSEILNAEKSDYEILCERSALLNDTLVEIKQQLDD
jgi:hypothetical protein